jgi:nucleoside-diphosphate-sugar epimerase
MILVTGGTGLLGSHLLFELAREQVRVKALRRTSSSLEEVRRVFFRQGEDGAERFSRIDWVEADLSSYDDVLEMMQGIRKVYHCAAEVSFRGADARRMVALNERNTANIVNACLESGVGRLLHVSSSAALGRAPEGTPADETLIWARSRTNTPYSVSKFRSEMEVWRGIEEGLKAVIVNPVIILGPGFWDRGSSLLFSRVAGGLRFATPGTTGFVGVWDVVSAMVLLMESEISGERFILSAGDHSYGNLLEMISEALEKPCKMKPVTPAALGTLARLDALRGLFTGRRNLTLAQARLAFNCSAYSTGKIRSAIDFQFTPVGEVVRRVGEYYLADHKG